MPPLPLIAFLLVGAVLRLWGLGSHGLWMDEAFTANTSSLPFPQLMVRLADDTFPPLHFLLVRVSCALLGASEFSVRLPSALCGILSVWLIHDVTRRFFSPRAALVSSGLLSILPYH